MKHRTLAVISGIVLCLLLALLLAHAVALRITGRKVQALLDRFAADGRPMTTAEVIPPTVPDEENAAQLYQQAIELLAAIPEGEVSRLQWLGGTIRMARNNEVSDDERRRLDELMASPEVAEALNLIRQAAERSACRFDNHWEKGFAMVLPHLVPMRSLTQIVDEYSRRQAAAGDRAGAWKSAWLALRTADALRGERILISQLVRAHVASFALERIAALAADGPPDAEMAARLDRLLAQMSDRGPLLLAMDGERLLMSDPVFTRPLTDLAKLTGSELSFGRMLLGRLIYSQPVRNIDRAAYLEVMLEFTRQLKLPYTQTNRDYFDRWEPPRIAIFSRMFAPAMGPVRERYEHFIAALCVTRTGLALERHRAAHGEYPVALAALDAGLLSPVPDDPFTGAPLIYRRTEAGFALYSVGPDGRDDGGERGPNVRTRRDSYDIPWGPPQVRAPQNNPAATPAE